MKSPHYAKILTLLLTGILCAASLCAEVTRKEIDRPYCKIIIYYRDGREVAREEIDRNGELTTTGKIPEEYRYRRRRGNKPGPIRAKALGGGTPAGSKRKTPQKYAAGTVDIKVYPGTKLGEFNRNEFSRFRRDRIREYAQTNLFSSDYDPFVYPHSEIYKDIQFGIGWVENAQFYVCNPYLLIMLTKPEYVSALEETCKLAGVRYSNGTIEETFSGARAAKFFEDIAEEANPKLKNTVRLQIINANDAGLPYVTVDKSKCENIDFSWNNTPDHIANSVYSLREFFHVGHYGLNNLSPFSLQAVVKIKEPGKHARIHVKLWSRRPASKDAREDFAYIITMAPDEKRGGNDPAAGRAEIPGRATEAETGQAGDEAPDFLLRDMKGNAVSLSSFRGQVVFLNFWASWCYPGRRSAPKVQELCDKLKGKNIIVVGISTEDGATTAGFAQKEGLTYTILASDDRVQADYHINTIPTFFIIGTDGKIIRKYSGYHPGMEDEWESDIKKALNIW